MKMPSRAVAVAAALTGVLTPAGLGGRGPAAAAVATPTPAARQAASRGPLGGPELARRGVIVNYPSRRTPRLPGMPTGAFVIADATTGQVLAAKNPHAWYGPASTLKILTAVSLIPALNPDATVVASERAVSVEPDVVGLKLGQRYKVSDLFRALLLISGNDAAVALAEATGSFGRGIALMNAQAHQLQADDTVARQPNGLDAPGQHVSAYDEALIARRALQMPAFLSYDETLQAWFPITARHRIQLFNQDRLLTEYPGFLGGKTGWTTPAMATFVGMARRHGHTVIVTLLYAVPGTTFTSATRALDWAFLVDGQITPVGWLANPLPPALPAHGTPLAAHYARAGHGPGTAGRARTARSGTVLTPLALSVCLSVLGLGGYVLARRRRRSSGV